MAQAPANISSEVISQPRGRIRSRSPAIQRGSIRVTGVSRGRRLESTSVWIMSGA